MSLHHETEIYRSVVDRLRALPADEIFESGNSYLGTVRQATHSHHDQARICNALRKRGLSVNHRLTKAYQ